MLRILKRRAVMAGIIFVLMLCLVASRHVSAEGQTAENLKLKDISGVLQEAQKKARDPLPENDQFLEGQDAAGKLMEKFNAPARQAVVRDEQQRLRESLFKDIITEAMPQADQNLQAKADIDSEQVYLFISRSVPLATLRNYAAVIDRARADQVIMVLRGFVGGMKKIRPTMEFIGEILKKDPFCDLTKEKCDSYQVNIQVDPQLFQRFSIDVVPTLAYLPAGESDAQEKQLEPLIIQGDATLDYLLERINSEAGRAGLDRLITALRGGSVNGE